MPREDYDSGIVEQERNKLPGNRRHYVSKSRMQQLSSFLRICDKFSMKTDKQVNTDVPWGHQELDYNVAY